VEDRQAGNRSRQAINDCILFWRAVNHLHNHGLYLFGWRLFVSRVASVVFQLAMENSCHSFGGMVLCLRGLSVGCVVVCCAFPGLSISIWRGGCLHW
jgi:hypothetical protein